MDDPFHIKFSIQIKHWNVFKLNQIK
jgi:hypothetical protein